MRAYEFDPELQPVIPLLTVGGDLSSRAAIENARSEIEALVPPSVASEGVVREDRTVPRADGSGDVPVRIYTPTSETTGLRPVVFEIHGGGFVMGSLELMDPWCDQVALRFGAVVVSVGYRLAPEHPFPAAPEDCYDALTWTAASAMDLGIDLERLVIAGQSAGGGLAAAVALMARDRGGPKACLQILEIPELDDRLEEPSMVEFVDTPMWNRPNAEWSWKHYLGPLYGGDVPAYAAPARCADLSGLPPAFVSVMEFDPLRDEGIHYAQRLLQAGVSTELHAYRGAFHGANIVQGTDIADRLSADVMYALGKALMANGGRQQ